MIYNVIYHVVMVLRNARLGPQSIGAQSQPHEEPPPSTLAAQLVDKYSKSSRRSQLNQSGAFRQLLEELLHIEDESGDPAPIEETNVLVNYKLIYVLVKAGLDPLRQNNPFDNNLLGQALNSLTVIRKTLERCPGVLSFIPVDDGTRSEPGGPLYSWLVPQLLGHLEEGNENAIRVGAEEALRAAISAQRRAYDRKVQCGVLRYVQCCIEGPFSYVSPRS